ncbi:hypothetical protein [Sphingorhabdus lacus]|uniref:Nucleotidyltransferase n=1 Tax=Sphingorhabdus lacus TaxID=392610 RepID=A0A6I6L454_9SPHN|nr:hypothetical protein [Sphingorhabdus lacus]QGY79304.1 hypothetical protein EUU25_00905 [Sphingorhabdus lacus]
MDPEEFRALIAACDPEKFCEEQLFQKKSWLFEDSGLDEISSTYEEFRQAIGVATGVDPADIRLVGSSRFGFSMNPKPAKRFRPFNDESDLDVLIVSEQLFSEIWAQFRHAYYNGYAWVKERHGGDIFRRFLYLLREDRYNTSYLRQAAKRMDEMTKEVLLQTGISRTLKYRIYANWTDAVSYHAHGIRKLQRDLQNVAQ